MSGRGALQVREADASYKVGEAVRGGGVGA